MASELFEDLRLWLGEEAQVAVFRSLLAVEVVALTVDDIPPEMLEAIRQPLRDLYELNREPDTGEETDV